MKKSYYFLFTIFALIPLQMMSQNLESQDSSRTKFISVAKEIMTSAGICALTSLDQDGLPRVRPMDAFLPESDMTVWFGTNAHSRKVKQIKEDPRVSLYYFDRNSGSYVLIQGRAELVDDPREKEKRWKKEWEAFYPVPFVDSELMKKVEKQIIKPTIEGIQKRNMDYKGFIFFGLIRVNGDPYVIEYNCRMGDPETEVVIPRIKNDLVSLLYSVNKGDLGNQEIKSDPRTAACIMMVSEGYPGSYPKGKNITGIDTVEGSIIFHAGTKVENERTVTSGGRVIAVTSLAENMENALELSRSNVDRIEYDGKQFRSDIGFDL